MKSKQEFYEFMWESYPDENSVKQYKCRVAMTLAYDFLTGKIDQQIKERKEISDSIYNQIMKNGMYGENKNEK